MAQTGRGLGRGLSALIPDADIEVALNTPSVQKGIEMVDINMVKPNENQPRKKFDKEKLEGLAQTIKEHGVMQPLTVVKEGNGYMIVSGERRFRASVLAGLKKIPVIIKDLSKAQIQQIALIENLQREDLNEIEEARAYNELKESFNYTQEEIADKLGKSRASIANTMRLLNLSDSIQDFVIEGKLSAGHARAVLSIEDENLRESFANEIIEKNMTVREAEKSSKSFKNINTKKEIPEKTKEENQIELHFKSIEEKMKDKLGTKVTLKHKGHKGSIVIDYFSDEEFERILSFFNEKEQA